MVHEIEIAAKGRSCADAEKKALHNQGRGAGDKLRQRSSVNDSSYCIYRDNSGE